MIADMIVVLIVYIPIQDVRTKKMQTEQFGQLQNLPSAHLVGKRHQLEPLVSALRIPEFSVGKNT